MTNIFNDYFVETRPVVVGIQSQAVTLKSGGGRIEENK
jgi:hypothetical protein